MRSLRGIFFFQDVVNADRNRGKRDRGVGEGDGGDLIATSTDSVGSFFDCRAYKPPDGKGDVA